MSNRFPSLRHHRPANVPSVIALLSLTMLTTCTPGTSAPDVVVTAERPVQKESGPKAQRRRLKKAVGNSQTLAKAVADVDAILAARIEEEAGRKGHAQKEWYKALGLGKGRFGKIAFEGWVKAQAALMKPPLNRKRFAKQLLQESRDGHYSPYMVTKKIHAPPELITHLDKIIPDLLEKGGEGEAGSDSRLSIDLPERGPPADDYLLTKSARIRCRSGADPRWERWFSRLSPALKPYWRALVDQCSGRQQEAQKQFIDMIDTLNAMTNTRGYSIEAAERAVKIMRRLGQRSQAADFYKRVMPLWQQQGVDARSFGATPFVFHRRRIDTALWAARYRALVGDYSLAKTYANQALLYLSDAFAALRSLSQKKREDLATLRAEAYHILSSRIALELGEWDQATSNALLALRIPNLNDEWRDRLSWFAGFYEYLAGRHHGAKKRWETMLVESQDETRRPELYFWLAKVYDEMGQTAESKFYLKALHEDFPLNYYNVVAANFAGLADNDDWQTLFSDVERLQSLLHTRNFDLSEQRRDAKLSTLLTRAEVMTAAELGELARYAVSELDSAITGSFPPESTVDLYVYLSRLHFACGNYLGSIIATTSLARALPQFWRQWPEQILIYFPLPHRKIFNRESARNGNIPSEVLMAISRQESSFNHKAKSPAGAYGMMQLIPLTAKRFAKSAKVDPDKFPDSLYRPQINIALGSRYLQTLVKHYQGRLGTEVFGAYNAGEAAMDIWLERRHHKDPLVFIEMIPFGETKGYVKNVHRNLVVYRFLNKKLGGRKPRRSQDDRS